MISTTMLHLLLLGLLALAIIGQNPAASCLTDEDCKYNIGQGNNVLSYTGGSQCVGTKCMVPIKMACEVEDGYFPNKDPVCDVASNECIGIFFTPILTIKTLINPLTPCSPNITNCTCYQSGVEIHGVCTEDGCICQGMKVNCSHQWHCKSTACKYVYCIYGQCSGRCDSPNGGFIDMGPPPAGMCNQNLDCQNQNTTCLNQGPVMCIDNKCRCQNEALACTVTTDCALCGTSAVCEDGYCTGGCEDVVCKKPEATP